ncbi:glycosyltransferase family 4 protein [Pontibacillus yanchengensis]|uniref:Glycosyl transferase n=1 Tax=Pontibacillus yanchengensis Y32 TaxID=1385514 RepID=A0A0A2TZ67_9BACI|nr:glycosyltransferase family 4 protein [Pontibacillus yanchengensis]KGP74565.1 hypothetical protein N782_00335 [Pontibacillus yanchengensis Y32]
MRTKKIVIFVANRGFALTNSRERIIKEFINMGWRVVVATSKDHHSTKLIELGAEFEEVNFNRGGLSIGKDLKALFDLIKIYMKHKPSLIHHFHAKPILFGTIATFFHNKAKIVNTVTGLGHSFIKGGFLKRVSSLGYKLLLSKADRTIFQNRDDYKMFLDKKWVFDNNSSLIISSGVDIEKYSPLAKNNSKINVIMVGRLLWQKGVKEYIEASKILKDTHPNVTFNLAGEFDDIHPDAVDKRYVYDAQEKSIINYLGFVDMEQVLKETDILVLPSYREGVPRTILEASACAIPVVTTNAPGCKEAVLNNETGYLVPIKNSELLAESILKLLNSSRLRQEFGNRGRQFIEKNFDISEITKQHFHVYKKINAL